MKKRYIVLLLFFVYVTLLFVLAGQFEIRDQNLIGKGFASRLGEGLGLFFRYITIFKLLQKPCVSRMALLKKNMDFAEAIQFYKRTGSKVVLA